MAGLRRSGLVLALAALAGCSSAEESEAAPVEADEVAEAPEGAELIECAIGGGQWFLRECTVEQAQLDGARILTVRHPDGGFRRFELVSDGRGLAVADGAVEAVTEIHEGNRLDVSVGNDRYRFPATIRSDDGAE
jgi:hypothetical protein